VNERYDSELGVAPCPNCGEGPLFVKDNVAAAGSHGPNLLPGLGRLRGFLSGRFQIVVCGGCGLTRFFADARAREKVAQSGRWRRL
jgi:ribosomal protein S27AE